MSGINYKWKINGNNLIIHNKKTGEITMINKDLINNFKKKLDCCVEEFLSKK
jgi:hypothetical protein